MDPSGPGEVDDPKPGWRRPLPASGGRNGSTEHLDRYRLDPRAEGARLVVLDLELHEHVEIGELFHQRVGAGVGLDAVGGGVERDADHAARLQVGERVAARVHGGDGYALEQAGMPRDRIEHGAVVGPVAGVGLDEERMGECR